MESEILNSIIKHIKEKKELRLLDDSYVKSVISRELAKNKKLERLIDSCEDFGQLKKKSEYSQLFKELRRKLRKAHGLFKSKDEYLSNYERNYKEFNNFLSGRINSFKPQNIIDFGAGLNPLHISNGIYNSISSYYAFEIDKNLAEKLEKEKPSKKLITGYHNLLELKVPEGIEKAGQQRNIILLMKVLEALEVFKKDFSEQLIAHLRKSFPQSLIIASFAKISSGGSQQIRKAGRSWFRRILGRLKKQGAIKDFSVEDIGNEILFIIE